MTVAHTEHIGGLNVLENHGEDIRSFESKSSVRRHA